MCPGTTSTIAKNTLPAAKILHSTKKKPGHKPKSTEATDTTSTTEKADNVIAEASPVESPKSATSPETQVQLPAPHKTPTAEDQKALANRETDSGASTTNTNTDGDKVADKIVDMPSEPVANSVAETSGLLGLSAKLAVPHPEKPPIAAKQTVMKPPQSPIITPEKPIAKLAPVSTTVQKKKPETPPEAAVPAKRHSSTRNGATPELRRTKVVPAPSSPTTEFAVPHTPSRSPTPKTMSIERQLADQHKRLEEMTKRRMEIAKKQAAIDEQMGPYKQRMAERLDRLTREVMEEESAYTEEAEHYNASVEILQEFRKADGGKLVAG